MYQIIILVYTYPPAPKTERGFATSMSIHKGKKLIAYCAQNLIIVRNIDNLENCYYFKGHKANTSAVQFNTNGNLICSGIIKFIQVIKKEIVLFGKVGEHYQ